MKVLLTLLYIVLGASFLYLINLFIDYMIADYHATKLTRKALTVPKNNLEFFKEMTRRSLTGNLGALTYKLFITKLNKLGL